MRLPSGRKTNQALPGLLQWWHSEFTKAEQDHILTTFQPLMTSIGNNCTETPLSRIIQPDGTVGSIGSLTTLAPWFLSPADLPLARRILAKGVALGEGESGPILDRHFTYLNMIRVYYRDRNRDPGALALAIEACEKQIALGPEAVLAFGQKYPKLELPEHTGFKQLAIIREKERNYIEAIRLSEEARTQGWNGDWEKRIVRCTKKRTD